MRITRVRTADFRNLAFADVDTNAPRVFLVGQNGQGKTNLIEAAGLVTTLRSFRTTEIEPLVRTGTTEAKVRIDVEIQRKENCSVEVTLMKGSRRATIDGNPTKSASELIGRFPTVAFCSEDLRLVRGSPSNRRRWLDLALSATDADYLMAARGYAKALEGRNLLLRSGRATDAELEAFERTMLPLACTLVRTRRSALLELNVSLNEVCEVAGFSALGSIAYEHNIEEDALAENWSSSRGVDRATETTRHGPHRDDFAIRFSGQPAADYASEGQQRLLVLALCLAQLRRTTQRASTPPVILADDVLGELDGERRTAFWACVGEKHQILATGTSLPAKGDWRVYNVDKGQYTGTK